jgi:hypothetical protein
MRPIKSLTHAPFVVFFAVAVLAAAISGCTAFSHRESLERLNSGYNALVQAEDLASQGIAGAPQTDIAAGPPRLEPPQTLAEARIELALDAQRDLEAANGTFKDATEYDRVSALYRAALKAWLAGNAWMNAPEDSGVDRAKLDRIHQEGKSRCEALDKADKAPLRDCTLIEAAPELTVMEIAADNLLDVHLARRQGTVGTEKSLAILFKGVRDISETLTRDWPAIPGGGEDGLGTFFKRQRVVYLCHATRGMDELVDVDKRGTPLQVQGWNVSKWLGWVKSPGGTSEPLSEGALEDLKTLLQRNGVQRVEAAKGKYAEAVEHTGKIVSRDWSAASRSKLSDFCKNLDRSRAEGR